MIILLLSACAVLLVAVLALIASALAAERRRARGLPATGRGRAAPPVVSPPPPAGQGAAGGPLQPLGGPASNGFGRDTELRQLLGLLSHELRSPLGAIIGYQELLTDGLLGPLPERALDAIRRIGTSGGQLRHLIDGLTDLLIPEREVTLDLQQVDGDAAAGAAADSARTLAAGRSVKLEVVMGEALPSFVTDAGRLGAALDLAIGAAVRASPGATLTLSFAGDDGALLVRVDGTALDPARDGPLVGGDARAGASAAGAGASGEAVSALSGVGIKSGAGLRLAMAARMAEILGGALTLEGRAPASLRLRIPSAPVDAQSGVSRSR